MTGEEMERTIGFILSHQAKLDGAIMEMRVQAEADRKEMKDAVIALVAQANKDRAAVIESNAEIKEHLNVLLSVMETMSALAKSSEKRLTLLEGRIDRIEGSPR